jgi:hypothetical protein
MSVTTRLHTATLRRRGVLLALVAVSVSLPAGCRPVPSRAPRKPPRLNESVTRLNYQLLQDYLNGTNADGRRPVFRDSPLIFLFNTANKRSWQGSLGRVEASIMPERDSYRVDVNDPDLTMARGGMVLAKIAMDQGSARDPLIGLAGGEVGYWFVERNSRGVVRSYVVRERDGEVVSDRGDAGLNFTPCHADARDPPASGPKADFYPADECPVARVAPGVRQQGAPAGHAAFQRYRITWDACPSGCCTGW